MVSTQLSMSGNLGGIYGFYLPYDHYTDPVSKRLELLKKQFLKAEEDLIKLNCYLGTLILTRSQVREYPQILTMVKERGWTEVASSANPFHQNHTFCHLFIKDLRPKDKKDKKVIKIKKFDTNKVCISLLAKWKAWKKK